MRRIKGPFDSVVMLQASLLFLHTVEAAKKYNGELDFRSIDYFPVARNGTVVTICLIINIVGLIGNGIVLWLLCCTIKKTKFTVYVANLAAADFLFVLDIFIEDIEYFTSFSKNPQITQLMVQLSLFGYYTNSCFLIVISIERCLTVFSPAWYQSCRPKYSTTLICAILWILAVTVAVIEHFLCAKKYIYTFYHGRFPCHVYGIFEDIAAYMFFTPIMILCNVASFIRMKRKPKENLPARLDFSIWAIILAHVIFSDISNITESIFHYFSLNIPPLLPYLLILFKSLASTINPFVYLFVGCWKRERSQEPCYMFLERALRYGRNDSSMTTQPPQEQT